MTGEMGQIGQDGYDPLNKEYWTAHAAVAKAVSGVLRPFDVYQGPYIQTPHGSIWINADEADDCIGVVFIEGGGVETRQSFAPAWSDTAAVSAATLALRYHRAKVRRNARRLSVH